MDAFTNPTSGKIDQQRKILEDLERQKKALLKTGSAPSLAPSVGMPLVPTSSATEGTGTGGHLTSGQRQTALESANKTSLGFFIHQDSAFGNVILPVIPRLQPKPQK